MDGERRAIILYDTATFDRALYTHFLLFESLSGRSSALFLLAQPPYLSGHSLTWLRTARYHSRNSPSFIVTPAWGSCHLERAIPLMSSTEIDSVESFRLQYISRVRACAAQKTAWRSSILAPDCRGRRQGKISFSHQSREKLLSTLLVQQGAQKRTTEGLSTSDRVAAAEAFSQPNSRLLPVAPCGVSH